jgi:hypothetical protein
MDASTRRQRRIVAVLLFGLALEEMILYPSSQLASFAATAILFGLTAWLIGMIE